MKYDNFKHRNLFAFYFTLRCKSDEEYYFIKKETEQGNPEFTIVIGCQEDNADGTNPHRHGLVRVDSKTNGGMKPSAIFNQLKSIVPDLVFEVTDIQPLKRNKMTIKTLEYPFKTRFAEMPEDEKKGIPEDVFDWGVDMFSPKGGNCQNLDKFFNQVYAKYDEQPPFNVFENDCISYDRRMPALEIQRAYKLFPKRLTLQSKLSTLWKAPVVFTIEEMDNLFWNIINNTGVIMSFGKKMSRAEFATTLIGLMIDQQRDNHDYQPVSPHFCLSGQAGSGKTLLTNMVLMKCLAKRIATDAKGVGVFQPKNDEKVMDIQEATRSFFGGRFWNTIKSVYHNTVEFKIHGTTATYPAMVAFMTTNIGDVPGCLGHSAKATQEENERRNKDEMGAFSRRFIHVVMKEKMLDTAQYKTPEGDEKIITRELQNRWFEKMIINYKSITSTNPHVKAINNYILKAQAILTGGDDYVEPIEVYKDKEVQDVVVLEESENEDEMEVEPTVNTVLKDLKPIKRKLEEPKEVPIKVPKEDVASVSVNKPIYSFDTVKLSELPDALSNMPVPRIKVTAQRLRLMLVIKPIFEAPCLVCEDIIQEEAGKPIMEYEGNKYVHTKCFTEKFSANDVLLKDATRVTF